MCEMNEADDFERFTEAELKKDNQIVKNEGIYK